MEIKKFDVMSVAKMFGALYGLMGLIAGAFVAFFSILGGAAAGSSAGLLGVFFGVGAVIALPLFYGIIGLIAGAVMAFLYNLAAPRVGGIKFE